MRCPRCRSEVGTQPVCPYCGGTVYVQNTTYTTNDYAKRTAVSGQTSGSGNQSSVGRKIDRRLRMLETKVDLLMILACGNLLFILLLLIAVLVG